MNPTIPLCYWCGEQKGEVALLGAALKEQAPMHMVLDRVPCEKCQGYLKEGIMFVSVRNGESGDNPYRTGKLCVIKEEAVRRFVQPHELLEEVLRKRICFIDDSAWAKLGLPDKEGE